MSATNGHELVVELLRDARRGAPAERRALLLDIPSGTGPTHAGARAAGYDVVGADLFPRAGGGGVRADACARLPFQDGGFDVVLSMEGIEHFEDQAGFLRECARVLRPGGTLIVTTPNVLHLSSRVSALLTGQRLMKQGIVNEVATLRSTEGRRLYHGHAFLIDAFRLRYLLRVVGLDLADVRGTSVSASSALLAPLVPAIAAATRFTLWAGRRRLEASGRRGPCAAVEGELRRLALSRAVLFQKKLIVVARKPRAC